MFWFGRRSYLRWLAAAALVLGAAVIELRPADTRLYPFAAEKIEPGDPLTLEWRTLPAGAYAVPPLGGMVAAHALEQGEPITSSAVAGPLQVEDGWWALSLEVPARLAPGTPTLLVVAGESEAPVPGTVVTSSAPDRFSASGPTALIAVPESRAATVAAAAAARQLVVLVAP